MLQALHATAPAADRAGKMMLYSQFIGSWQGRVITHTPDGGSSEQTCEVHFGWVLEGRAIQDVWIVPARAERDAPPAAGSYNLYGTTLRIYDPTCDIWRITWFNPVTQVFNRMTGRQIGADIIQEYITDDGTRAQWMFTEITPDSLHWIGRGTKDGGKTWQIQTEFFLRRTRKPRCATRANPNRALRAE